MTKPVKYLQIGAGWRAQYFLRVAKWFPDRLQVTGIVDVSQEVADAAAAKWGAPGYTDVMQAVKETKPDFALVAVGWGDTPVLIEQLVAAGVHVLTETPPAPNLERLQQLWRQVGDSGLVCVNEQYPWYPDHVAARAVIDSGLIGSVDDVHVGSTHMYHALAIARYLLGEGIGDAQITATRTAHKLIDPLSPGDWRSAPTVATDDPWLADRGMIGQWSEDGLAVKDVNLVRAQFTFASGKTALYEFWDNEWWNPIREDRLAVRGSKGEIVDDRVTFFAGDHDTVDTKLVRRNTGHGLNLEGFELDHISMGTQVVYRNPWLGQRLTDDEISTAELLSLVGLWAQGEGPAPYTLAEGSQDWALSLLIDKAVEEGRTVNLGQQPWFK